jgi:hypothetical protein
MKLTIFFFEDKECIPLLSLLKKYIIRVLILSPKNLDFKSEIFISSLSLVADE